jgi:ParB family chromosome partitioning protein
MKPNVIFIDPDDTNLVVDPAKNVSRLGTPWEEEQIVTLARSMNKLGQIQPCSARKLDDGKFELYAGFGRHLAGIYIKKYLNPDFKLKLEVMARVSDSAAEDRTIAENTHRRKLNAADIAIAMQRKIDAGMDVKEVAELFVVEPARVYELIELNKLNKRHLDAIREGLLLVTTAQDCLKYKNEKKRNDLLDTIVKGAKKAGKPVSAREARKLITSHIHQSNREEAENGRPTVEQAAVAVAERETKEVEEEVPQNTGPRNGRQKGRQTAFPKDLKEVRDFATNLAASPVLPPVVNEFGEALLKWLKGTTGSENPDEHLEEALERVFLANPKGVKNGNSEDVSKGWRA